jgi:hypothetical protein
VQIANKFDRCAAQLIGLDVKLLLGRSKHARLNAEVQDKLKNIVRFTSIQQFLSAFHNKFQTPDVHRVLIKTFRKTYQSEMEDLETEIPSCFLTGRMTSLTSTGCRRRLSIDHCHKTFLLRGLILGWINRALEFIEIQSHSLQLVWERGESEGKLGKAIHKFLQGMFAHCNHE